MKYSPAMAPGRMLKISMVSVERRSTRTGGLLGSRCTEPARRRTVCRLGSCRTRRHRLHQGVPHVGGPDRVRARAGYSVDYLEAGPTQALPDADILPHLGTFASILRAQWSTDRPDVVHSHFWMSGVATELATRSLGIPVLQTFHSLGSAAHRHLGAADDSPSERTHLEPLIARGATHVIATSSDEIFDLVRQGSPRSRTTMVPSGVDTEAFTPEGPAAKKTATASIDLRRKTGGAEGLRCCRRRAGFAAGYGVGGDRRATRRATEHRRSGDSAWSSSPSASASQIESNCWDGFRTANYRN